MKNRTILILLLLINTSFFVSAKDEGNGIDAGNDGVKTLSGEGRSNGGYGALSVGYTKINEKSSLVAGLKGGWTINKSLTLGGALYGYYNSKSHFDGYFYSGLAGGYAGLLLEPIIGGRHMVHLSVPLILGGGGATKFISDSYTYTLYFIFVPGLELEVNVSKHFRLALGFDYRVTPGLTWKTVEDIAIKKNDKALNGFSGHLVFKFGKL